MSRCGQTPAHLRSGPSRPAADPSLFRRGPLPPASTGGARRSAPKRGGILYASVTVYGVPGTARVGKIMPKYSESESGELRKKFEEIVFRWPDVTEKTMFGSPSYMTRETSFAMLVTGGIILTQLDDDRKATLLADFGAEYFFGHGRVMKKWILIRIRNPGEIDRLVPFIEASYAAAAPGKQRP